MNPTTLFQQTRILYFALLAGQLLFFIMVVFVLNTPDVFESGWPEPPFGIIVPLVTIGAIGAAFLVNKKRLNEGAAAGDLEQKMAHYRSTVIVRSALLEGANILSIVLALIQPSTMFLAFFGLGIVIFLYFRPSVDEFSQYYGLSAAEQSELRQ